MSIMLLNKGLGCEINLPAALKGESLHGLPPYAKTTAYPLDAYPACPENWERGGPNDKAFFIEVQKGQGLWIDLNPCWNHSHHVAAVLSIQGINPIDGKPAGEPKMVQYQEGDVPQNYLATTGTPQGHFWLDGFRGENGEVRQYFFTEETLRGIAAQVIGEARSFSIGIAFFLAKTPKPAVVSPWRNIPMDNPFPDLAPLDKYPWETFGKKRKMAETFKLGDVKMSLRDMNEDVGAFGGSGKMHTYSCLVARSVEHREDFEPQLEIQEVTSEPTKKLEIGAGARIRQSVPRDPERLDFWNPNPEGILYIHYVEKTEGKRIRAAGQVGTKQEGALAGLTVGN